MQRLTNQVKAIPVQPAIFALKEVRLKHPAIQVHMLIKPILQHAMCALKALCVKLEQFSLACARRALCVDLELALQSHAGSGLMAKSKASPLSQLVLDAQLDRSVLKARYKGRALLGSSAGVALHHRGRILKLWAEKHVLRDTFVQKAHSLQFYVQTVLFVGREGGSSRKTAGRVKLASSASMEIQLHSHVPEATTAMQPRN